MDFEWQFSKAEANVRKHDVDFLEASTVFADPLARIFDDPDHSAPAPRRGVNDMTTNKASANSDASDDLRAEYDLDYTQSRPNRFAPRMSGTTVAVVLEPDVAAVFDTSEAVNRFLRSVILALPADRMQNATAKAQRE